MRYRGSFMCPGPGQFSEISTHFGTGDSILIRNLEVEIPFCLENGVLHVPAVFTSHFEKRLGDLAEGADLCGFHKLFEHIPVSNGGLF